MSNIGIIIELQRRKMWEKGSLIIGWKPVSMQNRKRRQEKVVKRKSKLQIALT